MKPRTISHSPRRGVLVRALLGAGLFFGMASLATADQTVVRIWNWNIHDKKFQQSMYKLFNQRHPDIKIEYSSIVSGVYDQTLEAAFVAKDPPELFFPSGKLTFSYLRTKDMILPLNNAAPSEAELKEWMARYPVDQARFVEGVNMFNGKVYLVGLRGEFGGVGYPLFYNKTLFKEAGIASPPATYSELRQTAAKLTSAGGGKSFGIVHGLKTKGMWFYDYKGSLAHAGGARGTGTLGYNPDPRDGKYHNGGPESIAALQVWINMRKDGSVLPGDLLMDDEQAKMLFATNKAGLQFGFWWNPGNFLAYNPDCDFDMVAAPTPDDGIRHGFYEPRTYSASTEGYVVSAYAKKPRAVWEVIKFITSLEFQEAYVRGGFGISFLPAANKPENFTVPAMGKFALWYSDPSLWRTGLDQMVEKHLKALELMSPIYPDYHDVMDNVYLEKSGLDALTDLDNRVSVSLDDGIKKAQEAGFKITRQDFIIPGWTLPSDKPSRK